MKRLKLFLITWADRFDDKVLGHRFHGLCNFIGFSSWWGEDFSEPMGATDDYIEYDPADLTEMAAPGPITVKHLEDALAHIHDKGMT